jgi:hypothetical protein
VAFRTTRVAKDSLYTKFALSQDRFKKAKVSGDVDALLELTDNDEPLRGEMSRHGSEVDDPANSNKGSISEISMSLKSDMNRAWLSGEEAIISQGALNQLSYILEMARREVKLKIQYGNPEVSEKI